MLSNLNFDSESFHQAYKITIGISLSGIILIKLMMGMIYKDVGTKGSLIIINQDQIETIEVDAGTLTSLNALKSRCVEYFKPST